MLVLHWGTYRYLDRERERERERERREEVGGREGGAYVKRDLSVPKETYGRGFIPVWEVAGELGLIIQITHTHTHTHTHARVVPTPQRFRFS
jgi:hypothetical protein